jgi:hypothetical protein
MAEAKLPAVTLEDSDLDRRKKLAFLRTTCLAFLTAGLILITLKLHSNPTDFIWFWPIAYISIAALLLTIVFLLRLVC